jgi:hypothetical protein
MNNYYSFNMNNYNNTQNELYNIVLKKNGSCLGHYLNRMVVVYYNFSIQSMYINLILTIFYT